MANKNDESQKVEAEQGSERFTSTPALRHVGKTLESEPGYFERMSDNESSGITTPEDQIARQGTAPATYATRAGTDLAANLSGNFASSSASVRSSDQLEDLKTRLPGDTSSDPHTDLGPDNATTVQWRGER